MGLDSVELLLAVEERWSLEIPDDDAERIATVGQLLEYVVAALASRGSGVIDRDAVFADLRQIICEQLGVTSSRVVLEASFRKDLDML